MENLICLIFSFIIGGIPFGYILTRLAGIGDIRDIGSGNIGATNVLRTGNKKIAIFTLFLDVFKGFLVVFCTPFLFPDLAVSLESVALITILGHIYSPFLMFKGGKGVATALGVLLALSPYMALGVVIIWCVCARVFNISSLAALIACLFVPLLAYITNTFTDADLNAFILSFIPVMIVSTHIENIKRLIHGQESKINVD